MAGGWTAAGLLAAVVAFAGVPILAEIPLAMLGPALVALGIAGAIEAALVSALAGVLTTAYLDAARQMAKDTGKPVSTTQAGVLAALQAERGWFKGIAETTLAKVQKALDTAILDDQPMETVTAAIASILDDPARAAVIARTEIARVMATAAFDQAVATGLSRKEWTVLPGACAICVANQAQGPIPIHDRFASGVETVPTHPYDRCHTIYLP